jgi:Ca2+/H+ antiporter, TMEM165/GDT1 family
MLTTMLISFGVIFLAELPDKSQLVTITYALRHPRWVVLCGATTAAFMVHGLSVTIGHFLGLSLPQRPLALAAAVMFLAFAVWTWRESRDDDATATATARQPRFVFLAVVSSYLLAELGDMTMFASVALAAKHSWIGVWIGATAAMVAANGLAIAVGALLHKRLPIRLLHLMASLLFLLFGLWMLFNGALGWHSVAVVATVGLAGATAVAAVVAAPRPPDPASERPATERGGLPCGTARKASRLRPAPSHIDFASSTTEEHE